MKQYEYVIKAMEENGGFATLSQLYQKTDVSGWKTKTPFATIRRIVQDSRFFFKIKPGLWALNDYKEKVLRLFDIQLGDKQSNERFEHSYYQGLLVELGNMKGFNTFVPNQDKNRMFLTKKLGAITTLQNIFSFTYEETLRRAKTVDTIWFNERNFPHSLFEVEYSTDFQNSMGKYFDLQDFNAEFYLVSHQSKRKKFLQVINFGMFKKMKANVKFLDYDFISNWHTKIFELMEVQKKMNGV